ncbi:MAG TPA: DUF998 domain-containing protein [Polyangiaceae bacterium]|nr:DUF998 domain-containing protein [Polyangiaceae bacterium]
MSYAEPMTERLTYAGWAAGLLFTAVTLVEIFARPGFDLRRHAVSVLSLGPRGWVMTGTFIGSGLLVLLCAGSLLRLGSVGLAAPILIGLYGLGLVGAGVFPAPAGLGFPPGTPDDLQPVMDRGAILHSFAFMLAFGSLIAACFTLGVSQFTGGVASWGAFSLGAGALMPIFIALGITSRVPPGIGFYVASLVAWLWLAGVVVAAQPG